MPKRSKPKGQARRHDQERRRQLHEAMDRILDGPDRSDVDTWVLQVLVDIGLFLRAATPAVDYETGRVVTGADRPHGYFPGNLSWQGAHLAPSLQEAGDWMVAGRAARENPPPPEMQQRALAALLRPIANVACHSWILDLVDGLEALSFGEVLPILTPSNRGLTGIGKGQTAWRLRLHALRWAEFQVAAHKAKSTTEAYEGIAHEFGRSLAAVKEWRSGAAKEFGTAVVAEALEMSRRLGEWTHENPPTGRDGRRQREGPSARHSCGAVLR
jgi:hypothetical protein